MLPIGPEARRRAARIVDQDVQLTGGIQHLGASIFGGDVGGDGGDLHPVGGADFLGRGLQRIGAAGVENEGHTGLCQRHGAALAQPFGGGADQCALACNTKIHIHSPSGWGARLRLFGHRLPSRWRPFRNNDGK